MKPIKFIAPLLASLLLTSCLQDPDLNPRCQVDNFGTLKVENKFNDQYNVYVNNSYKGRVNAKSSISFDDLSVGTYSTYYEQANGYLLYPTTFSLSVTISRCKVYPVTLQ